MHLAEVDDEVVGAESGGAVELGLRVLGGHWALEGDEGESIERVASLDLNFKYRSEPSEEGEHLILSGVLGESLDQHTER